MRGWGQLRNWLKRLFKAEEAARNSAPESSNDSQLSSERRNTASDWAEQRRRAEEARKRKEEFEAARQQIIDEIQRQEDERAQNRNKTGAFASDTFGDSNLAPLPSSRNYGGNVPGRQYQEQSALWILSGQFHNVANSDNVYAIAYSINRGSLFVQYKHWAPGMEFGTQHGPGPIYEYKNVSIAEAHAIYRAKDVSQWLWDNVRVRGTWGEHRKPYRLLAISGGYMPRKATWGNDGREWFIRRQMWGTGGSARYSQLPNAPAPPMGYDGKPIRSQWTPDRGSPNRGKPNRGRP